MMATAAMAAVAGRWRPFHVPLFGNLLIAGFASDVGSFLQAVAAARLMVSLGAGLMYVALIQNASALPFFFVALPAGALGRHRQSTEFVTAIHRVERVRRRDGAVRGGAFYDAETGGRYLEIFLVPSWAEHLRQHNRFTVADRALETRITRTLRSDPKASHFIAATPRHTSSTPRGSVA